MARGPLPNKQKRRTNAPVIPTTELDAAGRKGHAPKPPKSYNLGKPGLDWWRWAWKLPQALAWDAGALYVLARRAQLEDDLAALELNDHLDLADLLAGADEEAIQRVEWALQTLKKAASGKLAVEKEMRELDKVLGLTPKGLADLRWEIVDKSQAKAGGESASSPGPTKKQQKKADDRKARLALVKSA
jgi:hypothetical protein